MKLATIEQHLGQRQGRRSSSNPHIRTLVQETLDWMAIAQHCDEVGECWLWSGTRDGHGYPIMKWPGCRCTTVRRIVVALDGRPAGPREPVASTCEERLCVNPAHLVRSTASAVARRAARKGAFSSPLRSAKIAAAKRASSAAKLTAEKAQEIRKSTESGPVLAKRYGVDKSLINNIKRGEAWRVHASPFAGLGARS